MEKIDAPNGRFYTDGENYYPSVTTIIDKVVAKGYYFRRWLGDSNSFQAAEDYKNEKAEKGTKVHKYCERLAKGEEIDVGEDSKEVVKKTQGYLNFHKQEDVRVIDTEFQVVQRNLRYAGTADIWAVVNGETWLIDIKTSSNIYNSHKLQLSFYNRAVEDSLSAPSKTSADKQGILWLKDRTKKGYQLKEIPYEPELVTSTMSLYEFVGDMSPQRKEKLPEKLKLDEQLETMWEGKYDE